MSRPSIGIASTFRDECNALPGYLESAARVFDAIYLVDCSMDLSPSTDGSLDIIRKWGLPDPPRWSLAKGFGSVRSQLVHSCPTDWVIVADIDERIQGAAYEMTCEGTEKFPDIEQPDLRVTRGGVYDHFALIVEKIMEAERRGLKAVRFQRRHWFAPDFTRPCENWNMRKDYQLRCMKARSGIGFTEFPRMHERAIDSTLNRDPEYVEDDAIRGPFFDHLHLHFKKMEPDQRKADIAAYDALHHSGTHTPIPA